MPLVALIMFSCEKETLIQVKPKPSFLLNHNIDTLLEGTTIGTEHNDYLDEVIEISGFPYHTLANLFDLTETTNNIFFNDTLYVNAGITGENFITGIVEDATNFENLEGVSTYLYQNNMINSTISNYLLELSDLLESGLDYFIAEDLDSYLNSIMGFIIDVKDDQNIDEQELVLLLGCAEVAYYSGIYWFEVMMDDNHPWFEPIYIEHAIAPDPKDRWWKKPMRLGLDVGGFLLGWVLGYEGVDLYLSNFHPEIPVATRAQMGGASGTALGGIIAKETSAWVN